MLYKKVLEDIKKNKEYKKNNIPTGIPFPYPKLNEFLTGLDKGLAIGILGPTGSAKSFFCRKTFLYTPYKFYKETGYKIRILYFCLEDSKESTMNYVLAHYLYDIHGIRITPKELNSKTRELPDFVLEKLVEAEEYFAEFETIVTFISEESTPEQMYKICKDAALALGEVETYYEDIEGKKVKQYSYSSDTHMIAVFDTMSNISESDETPGEQAAILKFVKDYMRLKLCNFFKFSCILVLQLDFESERPAFNRGGDMNVLKLEPTLASIGDSKRSSRSLHLIFSLFSPERYEIISYPTPSKHNPDRFYRIDILGNRFRSLRVIKSNQTETGMRVGLLFDGVTGEFSELPPPGPSPELDKIYKSISDKYIKMPQQALELKEKNTVMDEEDSDQMPF